VTFFFLAFILVVFFSSTFQTTKNIPLLILVITGAVVLALGFVEERKKLKHERFTLAREVEVLIATPVAAMLAYIISTRVDLGAGYVGPVIAAGLIGLIGSFFSYKLSMPVYCGSFVGMSSAAALPHLWMVGAAGFVAGIIFIFSHEIYTGTGGTLGTIAFSATNTAKMVINEIFRGLL